MTSMRASRLASAVAGIQEKWGVRAIRPARQLKEEKRIPVISTGLTKVDQTLGIGGLPKGRVTELITLGSSGYMALVASLIHQVQHGGEDVVYVDTNHTLDLDVLARSGVDFHRLFILRPRGFPHALDMVGDLLSEGGAALVIFDRLHPMLFKDGSLALLDQALREWTPVVHSAMSVLVIVTETIHIDWYPPGLALPYAASIRLFFQHQQWLRERRQIKGFVSEISVLKNKLAAPGRPVQIEVPLR